jgi:FMN phosphatase YigB (HAD superfamily)
MFQTIQLKVCKKLKINVDALFTSNEFMYEKPDIDSLEYIMNFYDVSNNDILIIGDSIATDILWAKNKNVKALICDNKTQETSFENCIKYITDHFNH